MDSFNQIEPWLLKKKAKDYKISTIDTIFEGASFSLIGLGFGVGAYSLSYGHVARFVESIRTSTLPFLEAAGAYFNNCSVADSIQQSVGSAFAIIGLAYLASGITHLVEGYNTYKDFKIVRTQLESLKQKGV